MGCGRRSWPLRMGGVVGRGVQEVVDGRVGGAERRICLVDVEVVRRVLGVLRLLGRTRSFGCSIVVVEAVRALPFLLPRGVKGKQV